MPSRRQFLGSSAALLGSAALVRPEGSEAQTPQAQAPTLPPAIAALTSMKDQMVPITNEERRARIEKARDLMGRNGLDAIAISGGTTLRYFSNISWWLSERFFGLVIPRQGGAFVVCPAFERDRADEQLKKGPLGEGTDIMTWQEHESPYALVADGLRARGIATGTLGIEETMYWAYSDGIAAKAPGLTLRSATPVTAGCRMVKSAAEVALMRLASRVTWKAYKAAHESMKEGMTQDEFARLVSQAHDRLGFAGGAGVQVGEYSALPHGSIAPQEIREGTILLIDGGCKVDGYSSDLSRTFVLGKATDRMKQVFEIVHRAQTTAVKTARPGLECQAVDAAARKVITDAGFGPDYTYFSHRVGHGIGMDGHEWPYLTRGTTLLLQPGMTFSDEPGIYIRGEFGVRLEDDMLITPGGAELLSPQSPSLETPFATG